MRWIKTGSIGPFDEIGVEKQFVAPEGVKTGGIVRDEQYGP